MVPELVDSSSDDEYLVPVVAPLRISARKARRQRSSNSGSFPVADQGSQVAHHDQHSPKRPAKPKHFLGVHWSTHQAVQDCKGKFVGMASVRNSFTILVARLPTFVGEHLPFRTTDRVAADATIFWGACLGW